MGVMEAVVMEAEVMGVGVTAEVVIFKYLFHKIHIKYIKMFKILQVEEEVMVEAEADMEVEVEAATAEVAEATAEWILR